MSLETQQIRTTAPASHRSLRRILSRREASLFAVLLVLITMFSLLNSRFASLASLWQVLNSMSLVVIVGIGLAIVLMTRNIDVSVGSMIGLSAYLAADFAARNPDISLILIIVGACALGALLGSVNGALVAFFKVSSIMVTLGTLYIYRGIASMIAGSRQVSASALPAGYDRLVSWSLFGVPALVVYGIVIALVVYAFIGHTFSGRSLLAIGSSPADAEKTGLPTRRLIFTAFALSGLLCGFVGALWGARYGNVDSSTATGYELTVLAAVVVGGVSVRGGTGSVGGVVLGAAILSVISFGLALLSISPFWLQAVQGAVIVLAIVIDAVIRMRSERKGGRQ